MWLPGVLLALSCGAALAAGPPPAAADPPPSLSGSGFLTVPDTATLAPGRFTVGFALDNRDRDPLGLDFFDYAVTLGAGLGGSTETYGRWVVSRVASLPEAPVLPPPPLDLVVLSGPVPPRPYYAIHPAAPYVNKRGRARFEAFVPGDVVLGLKRRLREARGGWPAFALGAEVKVPLTKKLEDLQSGSGTGAVDATARLTAQWRRGRQDLVASAAYTWTGRPPLGDRVIGVVDSGTAVATTVSDEPLALPGRVDLGLAFRRRIRARLAAIVEATTAVNVGARTATVDAATPIDVIAGLQTRFGGARLGLGLRYHGHALRSGERHPSPVAGLVDVSLVDEAVLADWLLAAGGGGSAPHLRAGSQRLLAGVPPGLPLPDGARVVPPDYAVRSEHQMGFVVVCAWAF
jgi:hypothetical protein